MAEDFPRTNHEDSDDSPAPSGDRQAEHHAPPPPPETSAPEGTIFERKEIAPNLSRPLFDFIRKQEQPEARTEPEPSVGPEFLPSVSVPGEPEVRTYQPPSEAEAAHAQHEATIEDDDDDDENDDRASAHVTPVAPSAPPPPAPARPQEVLRPLNEQFEEIMRENMGEDFTRLTSGDRLGEPAPAPAAETADEEEPVLVAATPVPAAAHRPAPPVPEGYSVAPILTAESTVEDVPEPPTPPTAAGTPPTPPTESAAFYYSEDEPDEPTPAAAASAGGTIPPASRFAGGGAFGAPAGASYAPAARVEAFNAQPQRPERQQSHNGRWFAAGFITGWVIKQHLANKKLARVQKVHEQEMGHQTETINTMAVEQQTMQRRMKRTEEQQQVTAAAQAARANQAQRAERATAAAQPTGFEQPIPATQAPERRPTPPQTMETPLQYAAAGAEAAFAGTRPAVGEAPAGRPFAAEAAVRPQPAAEQAPQPYMSPEAVAQELVAKAYDLQPGQHVEHAAGGGHNIIVDKHGHEVQDAMEYGEEFHFQQRQEQVRESAFAATTTNNGGAAAQDANAQAAYSSNIVTGLASGQADSGHSLPLGTPSPAVRQHLLPSKNSNPVVATVASPWLWAAVIVLLLAFFVAAFI